MFKSFIDRKTVSEGKLVNEAKQIQLYTALRKELKGTSVLTLVGHASGLQRHYELFNPFFKHIFVVERCSLLASKLEREAKRKGFLKMTIMHGDFFEVAETLKNMGKNISCLDFDGVEQIGTNEEKLKRLAKLVDAKIVINVGSARGQNEAFKTWCKENNKRRTQEKPSKPLRYELRRLGPEYFKEKAKGYASVFRLYLGTTNMWEGVLVKKVFQKQLQEIYV